MALTALDHFREGVRLAREGDFAAAEVQHREALRLSPVNPDVRLQLGDVLRRLGKTVEAVEVLESALPLASITPIQNHRVGNLLQACEAFASAEAAQRAAIAGAPDMAAAHIALATLLQRKRAFAEAATHVEAALDQDPDNTGYLLSLANLQLYAGEMTAAEGSLRRVVEVAPDHLTAHRRLSDVLLRQGRTEEAREVFAAAQALAAAQLPASATAALADLESGAWKNSARVGDLPETTTLPDRTEWPLERRWKWGRHAQDFTRQWVFLRPDAQDQLDAIVDSPGWSKLSKKRSDNKGAVLVGTHVGLPHVSLGLLARSPLRSKIVSGNGEAILMYPEEDTFNARGGDSHLGIVKLLPFIKGGGVIFTAGDGGIGQRSAPRQHGAYSATLALGPPSLAFVAKCRIFWFASLWKDGGISVELVEGPRHKPKETLPEWQARWLDFYWTRQCAALESGPENVDRRQYDAVYGAAQVR